jgi:hypothetical protein
MKILLLFLIVQLVVLRGRCVLFFLVLLKIAGCGLNLAEMSVAEQFLGVIPGHSSRIFALLGADQTFVEVLVLF